MARRANPARTGTSKPRVSATVTPADIVAARDRWRKHAPRRFWGLVDAVADPRAPARKVAKK